MHTSTITVLSKTMAFPTFLSSAFIFLFVVASKSLGFTLDLIHRDSPGSPYYNPSSTPSERLSNALLRSHNRAASYFQSAATLPPSITVRDQGEYLMNYTLGTPPVPILAMIDTSSDIIWTQCAPCKECYEQYAPLFDPKKSETYKNASCDSQQCRSIPDSTCSFNVTCNYRAFYYGYSHSIGIVASETFGIGSVSVPNITFGCGFRNSGIYSENDTGVVGLGGGPASLVSQLNSSIHGKFSYCLLRPGSTGKINFGDSAVVSGDGVVSTDIHTIEPNTYYYLRLNGFTVVGGSRVDFFDYSVTVPVGPSGNAIDIVIDSGTQLTYLPPNIYDKLQDEIKKVVSAEPVDDPAFDLCYNFRKLPKKLPGLTMHFAGADVELPPYNVYLSPSKDVACLAFNSSSSRIPLYGNNAQINFLVGYDLVKKTVSFKPNGCATGSVIESYGFA